MEIPIDWYQRRASGRIAIRAVAFIVGILFIYIALFLYEDEDGRLEDLIEKWWVKLDDERSAALSLQLVFLRGIAKALTDALDWFFGARIFSGRALLVSACYSLGVSNICVFSLGILQDNRFATISYGLLAALFLGAAGLCSYMAPNGAMEQRLYDRTCLRVFLWWCVAVPTILAVRDRSSYFILTFKLLIAVSISFACDVCSISVTRWLLRLFREAEKGLAIVIVSVLNLILSAFFVAIPLVFDSPSRPISITKVTKLGSGLQIASMNIGDIVLASSFFILASLALLHRLVWPIVSRPIYALAHVERGRKKTVFFTIGIALVGLATGRLPDLLKKVFEMLIR